MLRNTAARWQLAFVKDCQEQVHRRARCFAKKPYRHLLWKPSFPSDLPPALRQNAEVARYAAPEVSPHKQTWTIHVSTRLHEIAPDLCARGAVQELAANVIYHALITVDCKCPKEARRRGNLFRSDLFTTCSNLFEAHHVHHGAESVFGVLNEQTLLEISPKLRPTRRLRLRAMVIETLEDWVLSHREAFSRINASKMFDVVGPAEFFKLVPRLHLNIKALRGEDVEVFFYHLVHEAGDLFGTIRVALSLLPVDSISSPLGGCSWTLRRVLGLIEERRSENALRFLLAHLEPQSLLVEMLAALRERDYDTGLIRNKWSFVASVQLEQDADAGLAIAPEHPNVWPLLPPVSADEPVEIPALDDDRELMRGQRIFLTDGELPPFRIKEQKPKPLAALVPPSKLRDSAWPQLAFDPAQAAANDSGHSPSFQSADAYTALNDSADVADALTLWAGEVVAPTPSELAPKSSSGLPRTDAALPLDSVHLVDSAQGLSHVLTFLQRYPPEFVGVDLEWSDPSPVSLIQIATPTRAFVIDTVNRTDLYMSVLHCLMEWLLKREATTKLFFGYPQDLLRLNLLFEPHERSFTDEHLASIIDLFGQRVRRVYAPSDFPEDTPLGREGLLGSALDVGDFEEVQRIASVNPVHPPRAEFAERVFLVGGQSSLSWMVDRFLGFNLDKSLQRSNWNFRPLSAAQVVYAATDAHVLLRLEAALREKGFLPQRIFGCGPRNALQPAWWRHAATTVSAVDTNMRVDHRGAEDGMRT